MQHAIKQKQNVDLGIIELEPPTTHVAAPSCTEQAELALYRGTTGGGQDGAVQDSDTWNAISS